MEIAQEEVLTCIGMCIYNRLKRIQLCVKVEENACQVLAAVSVHALCRSFDMAVENKRGVNLELIYDEISREDRLKEEQMKKRKMKKRKKRNEKKQKDDDDQDSYNCEPEPVPDKCDCSEDDHMHSEDEENLHSDDDDDKIILCDGTIIDVAHVPMSKSSKAAKAAVKIAHHASNHDHSAERSRSTSVENLDAKADVMSVTSCQSCHDGDGECAQRSIDAGYSSETQHDGLLSNNTSSRTSSIVSTPEGSEVACSDVCCKGIEGGHAESFLTLEQMLVSNIRSSIDVLSSNLFTCNFRTKIHRKIMKTAFLTRKSWSLNRETTSNKSAKNYARSYCKTSKSCARRSALVPVSLLATNNYFQPLKTSDLFDHE